MKGDEHKKTIFLPTQYIKLINRDKKIKQMLGWLKLNNSLNSDKKIEKIFQFDQDR